MADQAPGDVLDALQFALQLEYLEADFYARAINAVGMIPTADVPVFNVIAGHEAAHVATLQGLIVRKGGVPVAKPVFDFTAKGNLPGFAFLPSQYATFRILAQALEDTGVRAYKGQLGRFLSDKQVLTTAMAIHSVEARHASQVRRMRGLKGWPTSNGSDDLPAFLKPVYDGEDNTTHGGVNVLSVAATVGGSASATEAFDEPLTTAQVTAIVAPFLG